MNQFRFLGTGTSQGIPVLTCGCDVCQSKDPRDKRLRTAGLLKIDGVNIAIDAGPDFRQQMLSAELDRLDYILITHEHNDHIIGLDDIRPYNFISGQAMKVLAMPRVAEDIRTKFAYIFDKNPYPGAPRIELVEFQPGDILNLATLQIQSIPIWHAGLPIAGFRFEKFAYLTDVKSLDSDAYELLEGVEILVLNALRKSPHRSHLSETEAIELAKKIGADQLYLTHASHSYGRYADIQRQLPSHVRLAYDGLEINI